MPSDPPSLSFLDLLGEPVESSSQCFTIYLPDRDKDRNIVADIEDYIAAAAQLLIDINGGVTVLRGMQGGWRDPETGTVVLENTVIVYSFLEGTEEFAEEFEAIIKFINQFRENTNQKEVMIEFMDGSYRRAYKIRRQLGAHLN